MPLLEQRGRPSKNNSLTDYLRFLKLRLSSLPNHFFEFPLGRYWALCWAILHLSGFVLGSLLAPWTGVGSFALLSRISCFLPALLGVLPRKLVPILWATVFVLGFAAGSQEIYTRQNRVSVSAPSDWEPSKEITFPGVGIFRPTAWAKAGQDSFWQIPATLLAWKPAVEKSGHGEGPLTGQSLLISGKGTLPLPGETLGASMEVRVPAGSPLPGIFDDRRYLQGRAIQWRARSKNAQTLPGAHGLVADIFQRLGIFRHKILRGIEANIPAPESHLMMAVLLGARSPTAREAAQPFSRLGLAHLFAVSGLHVGIIMGIILLPLGVFKLAPKWRLMPAMLFLPFYVLLTGAPGSVIRASGMTLLLLLALPLGRKSHSLQLLGLLFWVGIIWQPIQILDPGLRLSYLATGGIIAVVGLISGSKLKFWQTNWGKFSMGLVVSLAAQWFTFPQVVSSFGYISGFSPLANLFTVPLFGLAVWSLVLGLVSMVVLPELGQSLLAWTWIIVRFLTGILSGLTPAVQSLNMDFTLPGWVDGLIWLAGTILMLVLLANWSRGKTKGRNVVLTIVATFGMVIFIFQSGGLGKPAKTEIHVWQFAVGQGDCSLIMFPDGWCGIIDTAGVTGWGDNTGPSVLERKVKPWLQRQHIKTIGAIVLTHGHLDHTGGTASLLKDYRVGTIYTGGRSHRSIPDGHKIQTSRPPPGTVLHIWEDWELSFIQPDTLLTSHLHENDKSLVVVLKKGSATQMIWAGDMEQKEEKILLSTAFMPRKAMVLKAGHHGSNTSSCQQFLDTLDPRLVLISCGTDNQYHHPSHGPYLALGDTLPILRTDLSGSIHLRWDTHGNLQYQAGKKKGFLCKP